MGTVSGWVGGAGVGGTQYAVLGTQYSVRSVQFSILSCLLSGVAYRVPGGDLGDRGLFGWWFSHFENQDQWAVSFFFNFHFRGGARGLSERGGVGFAEVVGISMHAGETG